MPIDWPEITRIQPWPFPPGSRPDADQQVGDHDIFANGVLFIQRDMSGLWQQASTYYNSWMAWATNADFWNCQLIKEIKDVHTTIGAWMESMVFHVESGEMDFMNEAVHLWIIHSILPNAGAREEMVQLQWALRLLLKDVYGCTAIGKTYPGSWDGRTRDVNEATPKRRIGGPAARKTLDSIKGRIGLMLGTVVLASKKRSHDQIDGGEDDEDDDSDGGFAKPQRESSPSPSPEPRQLRPRARRHNYRLMATPPPDQPESELSSLRDETIEDGGDFGADDPFGSIGEEFNNPLDYTKVESEAFRAPDNNQEFNNPVDYKDGLVMGG